MTQHADIDSHLVQCRATDGTLYYAETEPGMTLKQAAELIRKGEYNRVEAVIAFNPVEGWSRDVSEDVAREVAALVNDEGFLSPGGLNLIEQTDGELANTVRWAA